ncbi:MAG TPA: hypothetical protein VH744_02520, partial [Terriglobales bacterium]
MQGFSPRKGAKNMKWQTVCLTLTVGIVALVLAVFNSQLAYAQASLPVRVTNTPLPVQGTVNANITNSSVPVSGTVSVSSLPAVQVSGTPSVTVTNAESNPVLMRDVDSAANEPFANFLCEGGGSLANFCTGANSDSFVVPATTPSGKTVRRMVIEFVSGFCTATPGTYISYVDLGFDRLLVSGQVHTFAPVNEPTGGAANDYAFSQQTRLYANPG